MKVEIYPKSKVCEGVAHISISALLPFNAMHELWLPLTSPKGGEEKSGEVRMRFYLFPKKSKSSGSSKVKYPSSYFKAVEEEDLQLLLRCVDDPKSNPNLADDTGNTPLHVACSKWENEFLLKALLTDQLLNVNATNVDENTPLHVFCQKYKNPNCQEIFETLVQKGANVNAKNSQNETPLHKAVINPRIRIMLVNLLIKAGAHVNECAKGGTPLHYAVQLGRSDLVSILIESGASLTIKDSSGATPLDLCMKHDGGKEALQEKLRNYAELGEFLERHGAGDFKPEFFHKKLFKWKLRGMSEKDLKKAGIDIPTGLRIKLLKAFEEITDEPPEKLDSEGAVQRTVALTSEEQRSVINDLIEKNNWEIKESRIEFTKMLGKGSAGEVFLGIYTHETAKGDVHVPAAIKILQLGAAKELEAFKLEFKVISALKSEYVVQLFGAVLSDKLKMVMEFCERGSLYDIISKRDHYIGWEEALKFAEDAMRGMVVIHTHSPQILHRDIKSLNLLVSKDWTCKLCDFGLARFDNGGNMETLTKLRGTYAYSAPEVYFGERYTDKSDNYSVGILLWELAYRVINQKYQRPYEEFPNLKLDYQIILQTAMKGLRPTIPSTTPIHFANLIRICTAKEQSARPSAKELLQAVLELKEEYHANTPEWESAIVGERVGAHIDFPKKEES